MSNDRPAGLYCPLCGRDGDLVGARDGYQLRECRGAASRCGGGFDAQAHDPILLSWTYPSVEAYERLYTDPHRYHVDMQATESQLTSWERDQEHMTASAKRLDFLKALKPTGTILDVGSGTGAFVAMANALGYEAEGIEPSELGEGAQGFGRKTTTGLWSQINTPEAPEFEAMTERDRWDIITLHDVWEHLTDPMECLWHLSAALKPGGLLVVEIPEWGCPDAHAKGMQWKHVRPLQHIFLPSDGAAQAMFRKAHLKVDAVVRPLRGMLGKITYYLSDENALRI